jgi:prepilin-type N-terminal cleavage/methylation domain-containing protein
MTSIHSLGHRRGFTLFEFAVSMSIVTVLAGILLVRTQQYRGEVERQAVEQTIGLLRVALQIQETKATGPDRRAVLARLAEQNPFDLLEQKPQNYLGEYYSPELEKIPEGNWVFDRRDKTLTYLLSSHKSFSFPSSNFLKFKVEFAHARASGVKYGAAQVPTSLVIERIDDQSAESML